MPYYYYYYSYIEEILYIRESSIYLSPIGGYSPRVGCLILEMP